MFRTEVGSPLYYCETTLTPEGKAQYRPQTATIRDTRGGGFYGRVHLLENQPYVIKTADTTPSHDLLRRMAWGFRDFPSQVSEKAAQLDYLATNLISDVLPTLTLGRVYSPHSFGYTELPSGYAQLIEEVKGRGPRFFPENEFNKFRETQEQLTDLAFKLGLEQVGQIHPDNPFALANLWFDDKENCFVWLDTLAAIKHERIFQVIPYKFHQEVRDGLGTNETTFNKIHIDKYLTEIATHKEEFDPEVYQRVVENAHLYETIYAQFEAEEYSPRRVKPLIRDGVEIAKKVPGKIGKNIVDGFELLAATFFDGPKKDLVFRGIKKAKDYNLVTPEQYQAAEVEYAAQEEVKKGSWRVRTAEATMGASYFLNHLFLDAPQYALMGVNTFSDSEWFIKWPINAGLWLGGQVLTSSTRFAQTRLIGALFGVDMRAAASAAVVPAFGNILPFPARSLAEGGSESRLIWHYAIRDQIAKLSGILPAGGWATEYEGRLYNSRLGRYLEGLAVKD
jgi:hypothetical protein